jgi:hypothetical protein
MQTQRKKLDPIAIRLAATTLILAEGSTTPLAVREALHRRGYEARQADIAEWLLVICFYESWHVKDNGQYRVYSFPRVAPTQHLDN